MRYYAHPFSLAAGATLAQDLWELVPATNIPCKVLGFTICNQGGILDAGDAQEEDLRIQVIAGLATSGSGGTAAATSKCLDRRSPVSQATVEVNNTTIAVVGGGTTDLLGDHGFNVRVEYQLFYPDELCPVVSAADSRLVIRLTNAPNDSILLGGTLYYAEVI